MWKTFWTLQMTKFQCVKTNMPMHTCVKFSFIPVPQNLRKYQPILINNQDIQAWEEICVNWTTSCKNWLIDIFIGIQLKQVWNHTVQLRTEPPKVSRTKLISMVVSRYGHTAQTKSGSMHIHLWGCEYEGNKHAYTELWRQGKTWNFIQW